MASARKKQDEKNLKILRELVSLPGNKHCFDCNQRGPTYVNMTIGSFVCTKCSGMLRGLTPPHRVKSISMASFTAEEVDFVKSKGNDYCRQTWLALYDQNTNAETKDEQQIKDFMIDKYERKRYYHDKGVRNVTVPAPTVQKTTVSETKPIILSPPVNGTQKNGFLMNGNNSDNTSTSSNDFVADFSTANFISTQFNNNSTTTSQPSFANFDNNIIFNSATPTYPTISTYQYQSYPSSYDLLMNQLTQYSQPQYVTNTNNRLNITSHPSVNGSFGGSLGTSPPVNKPPSEDRYAALKDLDNALKNQQFQQEQHQQQQHHQQQQQQQHHQQQQQHHQQLEWNAAASSNGSGYTSPLYGSPSTTGGSMYGSPSQGNFSAAFPQQQQQQQDLHNNSNPFNISSASPRNPWSPNGNSVTPVNSNTVIANNCFPSYNNSGLNIGQNPFRTDAGIMNGASKFNGITNGNGFGNNGFQSVFGNSSHFMNKPTWATPNPFTLGVSPSGTGNSNNPFL